MLAAFAPQQHLTAVVFSIIQPAPECMEQPVSSGAKIAVTIAQEGLWRTAGKTK